MRSQQHLKRHVRQKVCRQLLSQKQSKVKVYPYMENQAGWHGKAPNDEEFAIAMEELKKAGEALCQK